MAISRVKVWIAEKLLSADLNAEFNNILNNALSLISPLTGNLDFGGFNAVGLIPSTDAPATPVANTLYRDSIVKGWVKFDATGAIEDDLNVSSITDSAAGTWVINWATAFSGADYAIVVGLSGESGNTPQRIAVIGTDPTTTTATFYTVRSDNGTTSDPTQGGARMHAIAIGSQ